MSNQHDYSKISSELYAKYMLEELFPSRYGVLTRSDKPDLITQDNAIGVEVTRVLWEHEMIAAKYYHDHLKGMYTNCVDPEIIHSFEKRGNEVLTGGSIKSEWENKIIGYASPLDGTNYAGFEKLLNYKYERIKDNQYTPCNQYDLYVIWRDLFEDEVDKALDILKKVGEHYSVGYRYVYIDTIKQLVKYDSINQSVEKQEAHKACEEAFSRAEAEIDSINKNS